MQLTDVFFIPTQHPCLAGHFPNNPVVPGVVLLEKVEHLLNKKLSNWCITELNHVKFLHPVLPEERIEIIIDTNKLTNSETISFTLYNIKSQTKVAAGKISLTPKTPEIS